MQSKYSKYITLCIILVFCLWNLPAVKGDIYYQEFSVLADHEVIIDFEPQFLNCSIIIAPVGDLKYSYVLTTKQLKFTPHDNGTYLIRITGNTVYNNSLILVYVIKSYGKIVLPPPPSFQLTTKVTTVLNKSVIINYPELENLNVNVTPSEGAIIKSQTNTMTELLFTSIGSYTAVITGKTKEGSNYRLEVTIDVLNLVTVQVEEKEVKVVTYSVPVFQALLAIILADIPMVAIAAFFYRRAASLEKALEEIKKEEETENEQIEES